MRTLCNALRPSAPIRHLLIEQVTRQRLQRESLQPMKNHFETRGVVQVPSDTNVSVESTADSPRTSDPLGSCVGPVRISQRRARRSLLCRLICVAGSGVFIGRAVERCCGESKKRCTLFRPRTSFPWVCSGRVRVTRFLLGNHQSAVTGGLYPCFEVGYKLTGWRTACLSQECGSHRI